MTKLNRPETKSQAQLWDGNKRHYQELGLCSPCAAQAAWGAQIGYSHSHPPCAVCAPIVLTFPNAKPNGWRSSPRRSRDVDAQE